MNGYGAHVGVNNPYQPHASRKILVEFPLHFGRSIRSA
jgi:hypothetical protein